MQLSSHQLIALAGAEIPAGTPDFPVGILLTDSRELTFADRSAFFALRTAAADGHNYIGDLAAKGVRLFFTDRKVAVPENAVAVEVPNVLEALQRIGSGIRDMFPELPVIGITGSRGKTVVKELLYDMLGAEKRLVRSPRSYNSQIGVPLSLWELHDDTEIAVFEAGISQRGEMERLQPIVRPTIGIFTTLTDAHAEGFGSLEEKAREKARLFTGCMDVYYLDSEKITEHALREVCPGSTLHPVKGVNADLAVAVARLFRPDAAVRARELPSTRTLVSETLKNCLIIYDNFTNDLRSVCDALSFQQRRLTPGRKSTVILGDIADASEENIAALAAVMRAKGVRRLILVGADAESRKGAFAGLDVATVATADEFIACYDISDFDSELILVKGPDFEGIKAHLEAPRHQTILDVNLNAVVHNFNYYRSLVRPSTGLVAMVKAAGYGIGSLELAKTLQDQGAAYLAVAVIDEGVELRRAGITMPIIVMNPISTNYKALFDNRLEPSVFSLRELRLLLDNAARLGVTDYPVHIKLDTGMHRLGFLAEEIPELLEVLGAQRNVRVRSVFSHLATADCLDQDAYTEMQLANYESMSRTIKDALPYPILRHVLNTAGIMRYPRYQYDMVRLGIGLYGVSPVPVADSPLRVVARLTSTIISIKHWDSGITIGYGRRGHVDGPSEIATVAIGYADGLDRHLSRGVGSVLVNGKRCPIIGNICMDQCMVDVTGADAAIGDTVEIFGEGIPVESIAETLDTIPYEILTSVSPRVKRIYYKE